MNYFWKNKTNTFIKVGSLYKLKEVSKYCYFLHMGNNSVALKINQNDIVLCVFEHMNNNFAVFKNKIVPGFLYENKIGTLGTEDELEIDFVEVLE